MHSLSVPNQTEQDTHKQCEKILPCSMYETRNICTKCNYKIASRMGFFPTITGNESYLQFQQVTITKCPYQLNT